MMMMYFDEVMLVRFGKTCIFCACAVDIN